MLTMQMCCNLDGCFLSTFLGPG